MKRNYYINYNKTVDLYLFFPFFLEQESLYFIYKCIHFFFPQTNAISEFRKTYDKTVALGYRLDIVFHLIRMGLFYNDHDLITKNLEKAQRYGS